MKIQIKKSTSEIACENEIDPLIADIRKAKRDIIRLMFLLSVAYVTFFLVLVLLIKP